MSSAELMRADLVVEAHTGTAKVGLEELRREFTQTTGQMSSEALRAAVAQEKLDKAIARHGPTSTQAKQAELAYRREVEATTRSLNHEAVAADRTDKELGQLARGTLAGSGAMRHLGRSVAFASAAYLGSAGLVFGIRESIKQAVEQAQIIANLQNALAAGGYSWDRYGRKIESATAKLKVQSAFDDEELFKSLQLLVRGTGSVNRALTLNALAADVARGRNMGLVQAATLLVRVQAGQVGSLRRLGIQVDKGISGTKALAQVQQQYAGAASAYAESAAGTQELFTIAIQDTEKAIGRGLLPTVVEINKAVVPWLANTENQERIQQAVNEVVTDGAKIVKGLADGVRAVAPAVELAVDALGGLEHAVEIALITGLLLKARRAASGFGLITAASARTRTAIVADATTEVAAISRVEAALAGLGGAGVVGSVAGRARGAGAAVLSRGGGALRTAGEIGALLAAVDIVTSAKTDDNRPSHGFGSWSGSGGWIKSFNDIAGVVGLDWLGKGGSSRGASSVNVPALFDAITRGEVTAEGIEQLKDQLSTADYQALLQHAKSVANPLPAGFSGRSSAGRPGALPFTAQQQRAQALVNAAANPLSASAAGAYRDQAAYDKRALAFLEQRRQAGKISNAEYVKQYQAIYGDLVDMQNRLQAITDDAAEKSKAAADRTKTAADKAKRERDKLVSDTADTVRVNLRAANLDKTKLGLTASDLSAAADVRRALISGNIGKGVGISPQQIREMNAAQLKKDRDLRTQLLQNRLAAARLAETQAGDSAAKIAKAKKAELAAYQAILKAEQDEAKGLTGLAKARNIADQIATRQAIAQLQNDIRGNKAAAAGGAAANQQQFLSEFQSIVGSYAPNAFPVGAGKVGTQMHQLVHETRQTNRHLATIVGGGKFPASKYRQLESDSVYA